MEVIQVQPRDSYLHYVHVTKKHTSIHWSFKTKHHHINFGVYKQYDQNLFSPTDQVLDNKHQSLLNNIKSTASAKLFEQGLIELIPIQSTQSSRNNVEGSFIATDIGNYVLVFDNTFSKNTSKILTLSVTLSESPIIELNDPTTYIITGWLLKKRRKKLQGWGKRWFRLDISGILSYTDSPTSTETRGILHLLPMAIITHQPNQLSFYIHSDDKLGYHLKALTIDDYTHWTKHLKQLRENQVNHLENLQLKRQTGHITSIIKGKVRKDVSRGLQASQLVKEKLLCLDEWIQEQHIMSSEWVTRLIQLKNDVEMAVKHQDQLWYVVQDTVWRADPFGINKILADDNDDDIIIQSMESDDFYDAQDNNNHFENEEKKKNSCMIDYPIQPHRRNQLPSIAVGEISSAVSIFRKNVGKDLSTIALPVSMNEPISILQRACEELEYSELLDKAFQLDNSMDRLIYVTIFAITSYTSSQYRTGRKPFNPMMNETYENIRPDKGFRFISEKVCHYPLTIAAHAESDHYTYWQCTKLKTKFWGKSMELITEGVYHIQLNDHNDHYTYSKPSSWIRNMIAGEKYLEHSGEMKVINHNTGEYAIVTFKEGSGGGMFGIPTKRNDIIIHFYNSDNDKKPRRRVIGKWSDTLSEEIDIKRGQRQLNILWTAQTPNVQDYITHYGFTRFCVELNEITDLEKNKLPITDSRYRPDQRLYELGFVEEADIKKKQIEQKQRDKRNDFEMAGIPWNGRWFNLQDDPYNEPGFASPETEKRQSWIFNHKYWEIRKSGKWPEDMFELW